MYSPNIPSPNGALMTQTVKTQLSASRSTPSSSQLLSHRLSSIDALSLGLLGIEGSYLLLSSSDAQAADDTQAPSEAAPSKEELTTESRSTGFAAVENEEEHTSSEAILVSAYAIFWLLFFVFVFRSYKRVRKLENRLDNIAKTASSDQKSAKPIEG